MCLHFFFCSEIIETRLSIVFTHVDDGTNDKYLSLIAIGESFNFFSKARCVALIRYIRFVQTVFVHIFLVLPHAM